MAALMGGYDPGTRSLVNRTAHLVVEDIQADECGGATLLLSGGYRLTLFPDGSRGEDWRLFAPGAEASHFVVSGGQPDRDA